MTVNTWICVTYFIFLIFYVYTSYSCYKFFFFANNSWSLIELASQTCPNNMLVLNEIWTEQGRFLLDYLQLRNEVYDDGCGHYFNNYCLRWPQLVLKHLQYPNEVVLERLVYSKILYYWYSICYSSIRCGLSMRCP